jgi:CheY-like chemotaxis protein
VDSGAGDLVPIRSEAKVLVVDDDEAVQGLIRVLLRREGCCTASARDGKVAIEVVTVYEPDVILLDLMLPVMSGFDVLRYFDACLPNLLRRTIVVTAASGTTLREFTHEARIWKFLRKPFDIEQLVQEVSQCDAFHQRSSHRTSEQPDETWR